MPGVEPEWVAAKRRVAESLINKVRAPKYGLPLDLEKFSLKAKGWERVEELAELPARVREVVDRTNPQSAIVHVDSQLVYESVAALPKSVVAMDMEEAVSRFPWVKRYWFRALPMTLNKLTAFNAAYWRGGVFIRVAEGNRVSSTIPACFIVATANYAQLPHSIVVAERDSEASIVVGCGAPAMRAGALHVGVTEVYVERGANLTITMIHNWPETTHARPVIGARVEERGKLVMNYILVGSGASVQAYPTAVVKGRNAVVTMRSILLGSGRSDVDVGGAVFMFEGGRASVVSRAAATQSSRVTLRGKLWAKVPESKGHLDCRALLVGNKAEASAYPNLKCEAVGAELSHEAAIGRIAEDELFYLMSRGFDEDEAMALVVKGYLDPALLSLPEQLQQHVRAILEWAVEGVL